MEYFSKTTVLDEHNDFKYGIKKLLGVVGNIVLMRDKGK